VRLATGKWSGAVMTWDRRDARDMLGSGSVS
jgi:hypothetical protein